MPSTSPQAACRITAEAAADLRQIALKKARQIILKMKQGVRGGWAIETVQENIGNR
jgi:hypothetical protein